MYRYFWGILVVVMLVIAPAMQAGGRVETPHTVKQENRFDCERCGRSFSRRKGLEIHKKRHDNIRDFACEYPQCKAKFVSKGGLERHKLTHLSAQERRAQGALSCLVCGQLCDDSSKLKRHMRKHTPLPEGRCKRIKCSYCTTYFVKKDLLKAHILQHVTECELKNEAERALVQEAVLEEFEPPKTTKNCVVFRHANYFEDDK